VQYQIKNTGRTLMNIRRHKIKAFRNCPNPGCSAHNAPNQFNEELIPENIKELIREKLLMVCMHCGTVWYEEQHINSRSYYIVRNAAANWLENPWIEIYSLPTRRKPKLR